MANDTAESKTVGGCNFGTSLNIDYAEAIKQEEKKKALMKTGTIDLSRVANYDLGELVGKMLTKDAIMGSKIYGRMGHILTLENLTRWKKSGMRYLYIRYT
jgi:hypothetical protein